MVGGASQTRLTVDLRDEALYRALKVRAASEGRTVREIVVAALRQWLDGPDAPPGIVTAAKLRALDALRRDIMQGGRFTDDSTDMIRSAREDRVGR